MTFAPRFSPEGNRIVFSRTQNGASNIYALDLRTRQPLRLTDGNAIDTTPSYAPDSSRIVFNSDRGGSQQLYVMDASGGEARRISFGSGKYGTPVWSPRGDLIAFTKIDGGTFYIGVMRPDGSGERLLTQDFLVEGPTWAPNGRVLMYFRKGRSSGRAASPPPPSIACSLRMTRPIFPRKASKRYSAKRNGCGAIRMSRSRSRAIATNAARASTISPSASAARRP